MQSKYTSCSQKIIYKQLAYTHIMEFNKMHHEQVGKTKIHRPMAKKK